MANNSHVIPAICKPQHGLYRLLLEESGVDPDVARERGVCTVARARDLPPGFSRRQKRRAPGTLFMLHRPNGTTSWSFRPDEPDPESPGRKYEQPSKHCGGPGNVLDVHPSANHLINDMTTPVVFVEGVKKADALTSAARAAGTKILVVAISGVWNWLADGEPIPDMRGIPLEGRRATICFDSDMLSNPNVQDAARRLAEYLISRAAEVFITYLPDQSDGSKMGTDDFLAGGGTLAELRLLTRRYDPADFERVRLSRDETLRRLIKGLEHPLWDQEWKGQGGHSDRDVYLKLIEAARRHGKPVSNGVRVSISYGTLQLQAKIGSSRTLCKAINRLEERKLLYRDNEGRKPDKVGAFVLRASVKHDEEGEGKEEEVTQKLRGSYQRTLHLRAPRLLWSAPAHKPRRGVVSGTTKVRQGPPPEARLAIKRLGKVRGAVLDALDAAGGSLTLKELTVVLHKKRPRDLRRRTLPMLVKAGIIAVEQDVVRLTEDWLRTLDEERVRGHEMEAEETARRRLALKRYAFHARHTSKSDPAPTPGELEEMRPAFVASLEAQKRARYDRMRDAALEAFRDPHSGAGKNLEIAADGGLSNVEYVVKSVLAHQQIPVVIWDSEWEAWRESVLEAGAIISREHAPPVLPPEPEPPPDDHPLSCECDSCLYPTPRYARPYGGNGRRSA